MEVAGLAQGPMHKQQPGSRFVPLRTKLKVANAQMTHHRRLPVKMKLSISLAFVSQSGSRTLRCDEKASRNILEQSPSEVSTPFQLPRHQAIKLKGP